MIDTDGIEDKLNNILSNPEAMAQIMSLAQSFGGGQSQPEQSPPPSSPPPLALPNMDESFVRGIMQMMQQSQKTDSRQEALLCALKPYLQPERREKIDRAIRIARLSQLASFALRSYGGLSGKQGG